MQVSLINHVQEAVLTEPDTSLQVNNLTKSNTIEKQIKVSDAICRGECVDVCYGQQVTVRLQELQEDRQRAKQKQRMLELRMDTVEQATVRGVACFDANDDLM